MRVCDAKKLIQGVCGLLEEFQQCRDRRDQLRTEIDGNLELFSDEIVWKLRKKIKAIRKKREHAKRRKDVARVLKQADLDKRRIKSLEIDQWRQRHQELETKARLQESLRRQADVVLHSVRKQKTEAKRYLKLIPALAQLREMRYKQATGNSSTTTDTSTFNPNMDRLKSLWENQFDEYCKEELALKEMLDSGSAARFGSAQQALKQTVDEWELAMFGRPSRDEIPWDNLINIRSQWDQFLVPRDSSVGSSIPPGWLLPSQLSGEWRKFVNFF